MKSFLSFLAILVLFVSIQGCAAPKVDRNVVSMNQLRFSNSYMERNAPIPLYVTFKKMNKTVFEEGTELGAETAGIVKAALDKTSKYTVVETPEEAEVTIEIQGHYFGASEEKVMRTMPEKLLAQLRAVDDRFTTEDTYTKGQIAGTATKGVGTASVLAWLGGVGAINPLSGVAINLVGRAIESYDGMGTRTFYARSVTRYTEKGLQHSGFKDSDLAAMGISFEAQEAPNKKDGLTILATQIAASTISNMFTDTEFGKEFPGQAKVMDLTHKLYDM